LNTFDGTLADEGMNGISRNVAKVAVKSVNVNLFDGGGACCVMGMLDLV
jgi:hypothetical protein